MDQLVDALEVIASIGVIVSIIIKYL